MPTVIRPKGTCGFRSNDIPPPNDGYEPARRRISAWAPRLLDHALRIGANSAAIAAVPRNGRSVRGDAAG